jgi:hypothetical protein
VKTSSLRCGELERKDDLPEPEEGHSTPQNGKRENAGRQERDKANPSEVASEEVK